MKSFRSLLSLGCLAFLLAGTLSPIHAQTSPSLLQLAFPEVFARGDGPPATKDPAPLLLSYARTKGNPNAVEVVFSAPVSETTATNKANYALTPGVTVLSAAMGTNTTTVILTTTTLPNGVTHTLSVSNVQDRSSPPVTIAANSRALVLKAQGLVTRKVFTGIGGNWLNSLTNAAKFPNAPDALDWPTSFEAPTNIGDYYGNQMIGYLHPPVTGDYMFYIASDNEGLLYLSTDENPANKVAIARVPDNCDAARQWTKYASQQSAYYRLEAGKAYYIEALMAESSGNDYLAVAWRMRGMPAPANGDSPIPGDFLSSITPSAPVSIVTPPQSQTVAERQSASFGVVATGTPVYRYQWLRNGIAIPGATGTNYTVANATLSDHGAQFTVVVSNNFSTVTSSAAVLGVLADTNPPTIVKISGNASMEKVIVSFSEPVMADTAGDPRRYVFNGGLSTLSAQLMLDGTNVVLTTGRQTPGQTYSLTVTGVTDTALARNAGNSVTNFTAWVLTRGFLHRQAYYFIPGLELYTLTQHWRYPDLPDLSGHVSMGEIPINVHDYDMGERLTGFVIPPTNGYYTFYVCSDARGALYLSPDDNPANKRLIAIEPRYNSSRYWVGTDGRNAANPENRSAPLYLLAGQKYYLEAVMKNDCCGDNLGVAWQLPGMPPPNNGDPPIAGQYLAAYGDPVGASITITQQPLSVLVAESSVTNFTVGVASAYTPVFYQWQRDGVDIPDANASSYATPRLLRADTGARYRCVVSIPGAQTVSAEATVAITQDNTAPQALSATTLAGSTNIGLCFNELMDPASVTNPANYTLSNGGLVTGVTLRADGQSAWLGVSLLSFTNYSVRLNNLKDYAGNPLPANTTVPVVVSRMENTDIGIAGDPVDIGSTFACSSNSFDVIAGGSDIWNNRDGFHYVYQTREGDFDARVRIARLDLKQTYTFAGIVVRENLSPGSRNTRIHLFTTNGANGYHASTRTTQDGSTAQTMNICCGPVPYPNAWLRLTRTNDTFVGWRGTNGVDWTSFVTMTMSYTGQVYVGMAACPVNNGAGQATTAWFRDWSISPDAPLPAALDLQVRRASDGTGAFALNQVYQVFPAGAQILSETATPATPASFIVKIENDGAADQPVWLRAMESTNAGWTMNYQLGGSNITALITNTTGFTLGNLPPGVAEHLTVTMLPNIRVAGGESKTATISVTTDRYTRSLRDTARLVGFNQITRQPDLLVRRLGDVVYEGEGVFNLTGSNQTALVRLTGAGGATYPLKLVNTGNVTNTFTVTGTAGSGGWSARYFDGLTGTNEVTGDLTGGGVWVTLIPGATWEFRAEVNRNATVLPNATNTLEVTARSVADPAKADVARLITVTPIITNVPQSVVFTTDADFKSGRRVGTVYGNNQLTLGDQTVTSPYIWVPNSNEGTVSKVDIHTGKELGRYRTGPTTGGAPSRTTVDQYGNCWVVNRVTGTVIKLGLYENGQYLDRNGNGIIETSQDLNGDGDITGSEILPWGQDECVLYEIVIIAGKEGTFVPGTYTGGYENRTDNSGPRAIAADAQGNVWAGHYTSKKYYLLENATAQILRTNDVSSLNHTPYGAVVDANGILWSASAASHVLRLDPTDNSISLVEVGHTCYGLGLDRSNHLFVSGWQASKLSRINVLTATKDWTVNGIYESRGIAVTPDGDVWVANSGPGTVARWTPDGVLKTTIAVGPTPTGVSVDSDGKVWAVNLGNEYIERIDPATDLVDLSKRILGTTHYGYSDMTGNLLRGTTLRYGTWTATHDARVEFTQWGKVSWTALDPTGSGLKVRARSSNNEVTWSAWETCTNGVLLAATPPGQFLQVEVSLQARVGESAPILYDLSIEPLPQRTADLAITQTATPNPMTNRSLTTWVVALTNRGPQEARGVFVTHQLPSDVLLLLATNSQGTIVQTNPFVRWEIGTLATGTNATLTLTFVPTSAGTLNGTAYVSHYEKDPAPANNLSTLDLVVSPIPCAVTTMDLVSWWPAEVDVLDAIGNNHGGYVGAMNRASGKTGLAFNFDTAGAYVTIPAAASLNVGANAGFTVEAWIYPTDIASAHPVFEWGRVNNNWGVHFWISVNLAGGGSGSLYANVADTGGGGHSFSSAPGRVPANVWTHVALTYDKASGVGKMFCNGTNVATATLGSFTPQTTSPLHLGYRPYDNTRFAGMIDEPALYSRALSTNEIQAIYLANGGGKCGGAPRPSLSITPVAGNTWNLSWPTSAIGYAPQFADALGGPWQPLGGTPIIVGNQNVLTIQPTGTARFYRLKQ